MNLQSRQLLEDLLVTRSTKFPTFYGTPWIIYPVAIIPSLQPILNYFNPIDTDTLYFFISNSIRSVEEMHFSCVARSLWIHSFIRLL